MRSTILLVPALLVGCGRAAPPAPSSTAQPTPDAAAPPAAGPALPAHRAFSTVAEAIAAIVPADARVIGFGELHVRTDRPGVRPALVVFRDDVLPVLAPALSDLVLETWIVDPSCGAKAKASTAKIESTMKRPEATKDDLGETIAAARAAGVQVHAMKMTCADYDAVAPAGKEVDIEGLLGLVTRELARIATSAVVHRDKQPDHRPRIAVYGGALHNDRDPYDSTKQWSYTADVDRAAGGTYVEIDLYPPELAAADPLYAKEPWYPLIAAARPTGVQVFERGPRSFVVVLPTTTPAAPAPA
jgi:hypothetical protein